MTGPDDHEQPGHITAYLGLGANVGEPASTIQSAVADLSAEEEIVVIAVSGLYLTAPVGGIEQEPFLNAVVSVQTTLSPSDLLDLAQAIEAKHGRERSAEVRWGPRTLDIDVLLYGDKTLESERLTLPHPRLHERAFVLVPLLEVAPGLSLPGGTRVTELLASMAPIEGVELHVRLSDVPGAGPKRPEGPPSQGFLTPDEWVTGRPQGAPPGTER